MTYQTLLYEKKDGIGIVTLNRPDKLNALNSTVYKELYTAFAAIEDDPDVRVVIVTGSGDRAFAAGTDVAEMQNMNTLEIQKFMGVIRKTSDSHLLYTNYRLPYHNQIVLFLLIGENLRD